MKTTLVCAVAAAMISAGAPARAAVQFEFHITGGYTDPAPDSRLDASSFFIGYTSAGTNGGQDIFASPFNITRGELFSDPNVTPTPLLYADIQTFGYFGLLSTFDGVGDPLDRRFFVAAQPGTIEGQAFADVFADYLTAHPGITGLADFVTVIENGPDFPTPGAGQDWIDFNDDVVGGNSIGSLAGLVGTTFQAGETLDLIVFDTGTGIGGFVRHDRG
ncbi:MAG: hypothetical protein R3C45_10045 [Phycisphaerales bacterium]